MEGRIVETQAEEIKQPINYQSNAVLVYCKENLGYGDLIFGLKTANEVKKYLINERNYQGQVILVTPEESKKQIIKLGGDVEFDIPITTPKDISHRLNLEKNQKNFITVDCVIDGPTFTTVPDYNFHGMDLNGKIPADTPIIIIPEYNAQSSAAIAFAATERKLLAARNGAFYGASPDFTDKYDFQLKQIKTMQSGFNTKKNEEGILITDKLVEASLAKKLKDNAFTEIQQKAWNEINDSKLQKINTPALSASEYFNQHDLFFEYNSNSGKIRANQKNPCEHFLRIHQMFIQNSEKNQDIVTIGGKSKEKLEALNILKEKLIQQSNFSKIIFVNLDKEKEEILHDDKKDGKVYRVFYTKSLTHEQMLDLQILSNDLVGVTGDQSLSEAISAAKLIVYECLTHKIGLISTYCDLIFEITKNKDVKELATLLINAKTEAEYNRLAFLFAQKGLKDKLMQANEEISFKYNLGRNIANFTGKILEERKVIAPESLPQLDLLKKKYTSLDVNDRTSYVEALVYVHQNRNKDYAKLYKSALQNLDSNEKKLIENDYKYDNRMEFRSLILSLKKEKGFFQHVKSKMEQIISKDAVNKPKF